MELELLIYNFRIFLNKEIFHYRVFTFFATLPE